MRPLIGLGVFVALCVGGCSLLFNGNDLHGRSDGGAGSGGTGGGGGGDTDGGGGTGGTGGGGSAGSGGSGGGGGTTGPLGTLSFAPAPMSPTLVGAAPYDVTIGDFDGDGKLDAATANDNDGTVTVLINAGDGHFSTVMNVSVPPTSNPCTPYAISSGRFNADTIDDIVVTCTDLDVNNSVYIIPGSSAHSYTPTAIAALASSTVIKPEGIATGDFNHDGKLDVVTADAGVNQIWLALGNGDGTFQALPVKIAAGDYTNSVTVGDFNHDGRDDIAAGDYEDGKLYVYLQGSTSMLAAGVAYNTVGDNNDVCAHDLNGDGFADIVTADSENDAVAVLIGASSGNGTFPTAASTQMPPEYNAHPTPSSVAVADFNLDGKMDIVSANANGVDAGSIDVFLGNGDGTFGGAISLGNAKTPLGVKVGDFNGDGLPDIIFANNGSQSTVTVLLNTSH